jgi:hypothetical protein
LQWLPLKTVAERSSCADLGVACRKGNGTQERLWRRFATGKALSGSPNYAVEVGGGCLATGKAPSRSPDYSAEVGVVFGLGCD